MAELKPCPFAYERTDCYQMLACEYCGRYQNSLYAKVIDAWNKRS